MQLSLQERHTVSKIALTPSATGTGVFTIASPATNTDRTLTLPDEAGSIVVNTATGIDVTGNVNVTGTDQFKANSSSSGDYVRMYGSSGTGKWDIYGNGANLRIGDNESLGGVMIDTKAAFGTSPSAWNASIFPGAIQLGGQGVLAATAVSAQFGLNWYYSDEYRYIGTGQASRIYHVAGALVFENASSGTADDAITWSESMQIDSSGNLLVNRTSGLGSAKFVVEQDTTIANPMAVSNPRSTASTDYSILFYRNGSIVGSVQTSLSATSYVTSSDYRLKTDAQPMTGASARVQALKPVNFEWISSGERVDGFLAHEAQEIVPEAVTGTKDAMRDEEYEVTAAVLDDDGMVVTEAVMGTRSVPDMQGIDQSKLVPLLTAALQEALTKIEAMEIRLAALEAV
jgi:hypothetical protein